MAEREKKLPVYLVNGEDAFERKQAVTAILNTLAPDFSHGYKIFECDQAPWSQVMDELHSLPLFVTERVVHLRSVGELTKEHTEELTAYIHQSSPGVYLLLEGQGIRSNSLLAKAVEAHGKLVKQTAEKPWAKEKVLPQWVQDRVRAAGKQIDSAAAKLLADWVGDDKQQICMEIEKLLCYIDARPKIGVEDIRALCVATKSESVFKLSDAVFARKGGEALKLAHQSLADGVAPIALLRQLRQQFGTKAELLTLAPESVRARFSYMTDWVERQAREVATQYGYEPLLRGIVAIDRAEFQCKNSDASPAIILDRLIHSLVS